ncbi:hypothetical protein [Modestobacter roseus]|uniref:Uncharacterized protein n=1 Tax=Modestobacter roseus TaxID=1181884 RepID=A0A562INQ1_9ACTN|nr:hypothetical protein [Modestobacter roseus]MQA34201.1 hypothetical protein [Modestobacter roseus]TWH72522.1 hypothetical protein JD78_01038 [Modestobacter roseus]
MASLAAHRVHAVVSSVVDGVAVGGAEAALDLPPRSAARWRVYLAVMAAVAADTVAQDLPSLRRAFQGMPLEPTDPADHAVLRHQGLVSTGWGLGVTAVHRPLARALRRRGHRRPHLLLGVLAGIGTSACTLPVRWRRATERAAEDAAAARMDAELAELLTQSAD